MTALQLICPNDGAATLPARVRTLTRVFPDLQVAAARSMRAVTSSPRPDEGTLTVDGARWRHPAFDPVTVDREMTTLLESARKVTLRVIDETADGSNVTALQVVTRYQRLLAGRNRHSSDALFDRVLGRHRVMHDVSKPLVVADFDHALDVWRWVLRLEPDASLAVQAAALLHDIERLESESDVRIEQHATDYRAFKSAHAAAGARRAAQVLADAGADASLCQRVQALIDGHELPGPGAGEEQQLLTEADALSFFSLNACGFVSYYGLPHTRMKVAYTLDRLGARGLRELPRIRHRADVAALIDEAQSGRHPPESHLPDPSRPTRNHRKGGRP